MAKIKARVRIDHVAEFESEDYRNDWEEHCEENGLEVPPDIPADFALARWTREVEDGIVDLAEILETAAVDIEAVA
jgi:hypothetical protein